MNSRSGMSTPVESISTVTTILDCGRLRNSRMRWRVGRRGPGDLLDKGVAATEDPPADVDKLFGMGGVRQIVDREDKGLREVASGLLMLRRVLIDFRNDLPVGIRRGHLALDRRGIELALVLEASMASRPVSGSMMPTCSPSLRNSPFMRTSELIFTAS